MKVPTVGNGLCAGLESRVDGDCLLHEWVTGTRSERRRGVGVLHGCMGNSSAEPRRKLGACTASLGVGRGLSWAVIGQRSDTGLSRKAVEETSCIFSSMCRAGKPEPVSGIVQRRKVKKRVPSINLIVHRFLSSSFRAEKGSSRVAN